jgi:hypothetical protein
MSVGVVHQLETIHVHQAQRQVAPRALRLGHAREHAFGERASRQESGEQVAVTLFAEHARAVEADAQAREQLAWRDVEREHVVGARLETGLLHFGAARARQNRQVAPTRRRPHQAAQQLALRRALIEHQRARLRSVQGFEHELWLVKHLELHVFCFQRIAQPIDAAVQRQRQDARPLLQRADFQRIERGGDFVRYDWQEKVQDGPQQRGRTARAVAAVFGQDQERHARRAFSQLLDALDETFRLVCSQLDD